MSWPIAAIGDVCDVVGGGTPSKSRADFYGGSIPWASIRDMRGDWIESTEFGITEEAVASSATNVIPAGNVIIATRVGLGKVARLRRDAAINQDIRAVVPRDNTKLDKQYLFHWFKSISHIIEAEGKGATVKGVTLPFVKSLKLPLPSMPEQHRVVAFLDEAFAGIATAKANVEKSLRCAREVFESARQDLFSSVGEVCETSLGNEVELLVGFAFKSSGYVDTGDSVRLLRGDNIIQGSIRWDDAKRWSAADADGYARFALREGDVVLAMDRPWVKAGLKRALLQAEDVPALLVQRTACLRAGPRLDNRYMFQLISANDFSRHLLGVQTGIGVPHISGQQIKDFTFALPPLAEQRRILVQLDALQAETRHLESIYTRKLAALDELKQSLLQRAFSGQL